MKSPDRRGVFVGLTTVDLVLRVERHPLPNRKSVAQSRHLLAGGPAANAAIEFARLGGSAVLVTALGASPLASVARDDLARHRVELLDYATGPDLEPPLAVVLSDASDGSRAVVLSRGTDGGSQGMEDIAVDEEVLEGAVIVLCDGHHPHLAAPLLAAARRRQIPTVLDAGSWKPALTEMLPLIDYAIASADFALSADEAISRLLALGARHAAVSAGPEPVRWRSAEGAAGEIAVPAVEAIDTLGAGDILHGAFAWFVAQGAEFREALHEAARVASESCTVFGRR